MSRIVDFYSGSLKHPRGVLIESIWKWNYPQLEIEHTYIQWLFPLTERSGAVPSSPVLNSDDLREFHHSEDLKNRVRSSLRTMLAFYGFRMNYTDNDQNAPQITPSEEYDERLSHWATVNNHNYLRITRILKSLGLLGLSREAKEFFAALQRVYVKHHDVIGAYTYEYWKNATRA